jgi:tetratricopeptide (TPR) repeat protein
MERDNEAIDLLRVLTKEDPARPGPLVSLGDLLRSNKRFEGSVDAYDQAISRLGEIEKRHWKILYSRGISLERSRQWSRAEKDFERALELNPEQPYVLNYLGYSWVDQVILSIVSAGCFTGSVISRARSHSWNGRLNCGHRTRRSTIIWAMPIGGLDGLTRLGSSGGGR